ncbi:MAG: AmmeMemoRadiSam system radical SAM enzyme [Desulfobulbaceae bacterium]
MRRSRRRFVKHCFMTGCGLALGAWSLEDYFSGEKNAGLRVGFRNDAPPNLGPWSREADWYEVRAGMIHCTLCPHRCVLGENDRGFCRTRVVKHARLHTIAYGNPCSVHIDPVEKKPLYHFLPGSPILSVATGGCNLRCLNCQNWQISQAKPDELRNHDLPPERLAEAARQRRIPAIAYTYSEPLVFYEYVRDTALPARESKIRNVLVTAGYIEEGPLRALCGVVDAANVDLKGFSDRFYRKVCSARLEPVKQALKIMREEGVWLEVTKLTVPTLSDDMDDLRVMCDWMAETLGVSTPLHLSRFHPQYRLQHLPPTPVDTLYRAREVAMEAGLHFVYVGNVPDSPFQNTACPQCGETVIRRKGFLVIENRLARGRCPCGEEIPGVWL